MFSSCNPCQTERKLIEAATFCLDCEEYFCTNCTELHSKFPCMKTHSSVPCDEMHMFPLALIQQSTRCASHPEDVVEYYCAYHCQSFCFHCLIHSHRNCDYSTTEKVSKGVKSSYRFTDLIHRIENSYKVISELKNYKSENLTDLLGQKTKLEAELYSILNQINSCVLDAIKESTKLFTEEYKKLQTEITKLQEREQEVFKHKKDLEQISKYCSEANIFLSLGELEKIFLTDEEDYSSTTVQAKRLELSIDKKDQLHTILGELEKIKIDTVLCSIPRHFIPLSPAQLTVGPIQQTNSRTPSLTLQRHINISEKGVKDPCVSDCTLFQDGYIIGTEQRHICLLEFTLDGQIHRNVKIQSRPTCISRIGQDKFAVTQDDEVVIYNRKGMNSIENVSIRDCCSGIAVFNEDKIFVGCYSSGIQVLGNNGRREKIIRTKELMHLQQDMYISTENDKQILCSLSQKETVISIDYKGYKKFQFQDKTLKGPRGIVIDKIGDLYVAGYTSSNVLWISSDGKKSSEVLNIKHDIRNPRGMSYNGFSNILVICNCNGSKLSIFELH